MARISRIIYSVDFIDANYIETYCVNKLTAMADIDIVYTKRCDVIREIMGKETREKSYIL